MARPRIFDEGAVLDAAVQCFWKQGFEAISVREADRVAQGINQSMDLGAQPAAGPSDRLIFAVFFLAPALC